MYVCIYLRGKYRIHISFLYQPRGPRNNETQLALGAKTSASNSIVNERYHVLGKQLSVELGLYITDKRGLEWLALQDTLKSTKMSNKGPNKNKICTVMKGPEWHRTHVKVLSMVKAGRIMGQCMVAPGYKSKYMANIRNSKSIKNKTKINKRHSFCAKEFQIT